MNLESNVAYYMTTDIIGGGTRLGVRGQHSEEKQQKKKKKKEKKKRKKRSFSKFTRKLQILPQNLGGGGAKPYCCPPHLWNWGRGQSSYRAISNYI